VLRRGDQKGQKRESFASKGVDTPILEGDGIEGERSGG